MLRNTEGDLYVWQHLHPYMTLCLFPFFLLVCAPSAFTHATEGAPAPSLAAGVPDVWCKPMQHRLHYHAACQQCLLEMEDTYCKH